MSRYGFIAAGNQDNPIPGNDVGMDFYHIGNDFTAGQDKVHAVMALRPSVADIGNVEISRLAACFIYANGCLFGIFIKMNTARVAFTPYIINQYNRLYMTGRMLPGAAYGPSSALAIKTSCLFHQTA